MEDRVFRVATYCRVSTSSEDQLNSFERQMSMYTEEIKSHENWVLYKSYYDKGISGTEVMNRPGFLEMKQAGLDSNYDILITREVSRLSRNIQQFYEFVRPLVKRGIRIYFLDDEVDSGMPDFEIRAAGLISHAQDESRKTSQRVKRGQQMAMKSGRVFGTSLLGYDVIDSRLYINQEGAKTVKYIFDMYVNEGIGIRQIKKRLEEAECMTVKNNFVWSLKSIHYILRNEKYCGDIVQGKTTTCDYLTHERCLNKGDMVELHNHHEPIIGRDIWEKAQERLDKNNVGKNTGRYAMSGKIRCSECGKNFVSRMRSNGIRVWRCATVCSEGAGACRNSKQLRDDAARYMFVSSISQLILEREKLIKDVCEAARRSIKYGINNSVREFSDNISEIARLNDMQRMLIEMKLSGKYPEDLIVEKLNAVNDEIRIIENCKFSEHPDRYDVVEKNMIKFSESILCGEKESDIFIRELLKRITVYPDRTAELEFNHIKEIWRFSL